MTATEMEKEFDIAYDFISNFDAPGLEKDEKSIFLTRAQKLFVDKAVNGLKNEENRRKVGLLKRSFTYSSFVTGEYPDSWETNISEDIIKIVNEYASLIPTSDHLYYGNSFTGVKVKPIDDDYYHDNIKNPYKKPNHDLIWRLDYGKKDEDTYISKEITYEDEDDSVTVGLLNEGDKIYDIKVYVSEVFNATIATLYIGTSTDSDKYEYLVSGLDSVGWKTLTLTNIPEILTSDTTIKIKYKEGVGDSATTGILTVYVYYIPETYSTLTYIIPDNMTLSDVHVNAYVKPEPIIIKDENYTEDNGSIEGFDFVDYKTYDRDCKLNSFYHKDIVDLAVKLAQGAIENEKGFQISSVIEKDK